jgi:hypothetical protein
MAVLVATALVTADAGARRARARVGQVMRWRVGQPSQGPGREAGLADHPEGRNALKQWPRLQKATQTSSSSSSNSSQGVNSSARMDGDLSSSSRRERLKVLPVMPSSARARGSLTTPGREGAVGVLGGVVEASTAGKQTRLKAMVTASSDRSAGVMAVWGRKASTHSISSGTVGRVAAEPAGGRVSEGGEGAGAIVAAVRATRLGQMTAAATGKGVAGMVGVMQAGVGEGVAG